LSWERGIEVGRGGIEKGRRKEAGGKGIRGAFLRPNEEDEGRRGCCIRRGKGRCGEVETSKEGYKVARMLVVRGRKEKRRWRAAGRSISPGTSVPGERKKILKSAHIFVLRLKLKSR